MSLTDLGCLGGRLIDGLRKWLALLIDNLHESFKKTGKAKTFLGKSLRAMQGPTFYLRRNL